MTQHYSKILKEKIKSLERELETYKSHSGKNSDRLNFLNCLLDQSLVGIYAIDEGHFSYTNKTFATIFGYDSPSEIAPCVRIDVASIKN
jgi:PAS domain-containing protein